MKFSIILPIYKVDKYLNKCVDSVLGQSFSDFEVILVDDGSPDSCPQICDEYAKKDNRVNVIHQKNAGLSCARNSGIAQAKGEYLICIDSDDYLANDHVLADIVEKLQSQPDIVIYGFKKYFESDGSFAKEECPVLETGMSVQDSLKSLLLNGGYTATAWTKVIRTELLHEHNIQFRPGMISEDIDWFMDLICYVEKIECLSKACVIYRQRPGSISHDPNLNSLTDNIWILETWPARFKERKLNKELEKCLMNAMAYYFANLMVLYSSYPYNIIREYRSKVKPLSYLQQYAVTSRALTVRKFYKLLGFNITVLLLKILGKLKKRQ